MRGTFHWALLAGLLLAACGDMDNQAPEGASESGGELSVGNIDGLDAIKADGSWGYATQCKPIPTVQPLVDPVIVISLDGLTLHLYDRAGDYDRVFPVGPGAIENGVSLTPVSTGTATGNFYTRTDEAPVAEGPTPSQQRWGYNYRCKIWWTDPDNGQLLPVFAGLPFIRLYGPSGSGYGIHGPIDYFTQANGGRLRRGYVSHGCIRMEAADLLEVWGRIQGRRAPVRIQRAVERRADDRAVEVADPWIMSECQTDADCAYAGGICRHNDYSDHGFCTQACTRYCPDRYGYPSTFCVADPTQAGAGMCVYQSSPLSNGCRRFDHFLEFAGVARRGDASVRRNVCLPGTEGWIGDRCLSNGDCASGACAAVDGGPAGVCTQSCSRYCPDRTGGYAGTFCVAGSDFGVSGGTCAATCSNNDDCSVGTTCERAARFQQSTVVRNACMPY